MVDGEPWVATVHMPCESAERMRGQRDWAAAAPQGRKGAKGGSRMSLLCSFALDHAVCVVLPVPHLLSLPNRFQQHRVCNRLCL